MRSKRPDVMTWRPALCIKGAKQPPHRRLPRPGADTLHSAFCVGYSVRRLNHSLPIGKLSLWPATLLGRPSVPVRACMLNGRALRRGALNRYNHPIAGRHPTRRDQISPYQVWGLGLCRVKSLMIATTQLTQTVWAVSRRSDDGALSSRPACPDAGGLQRLHDTASGLFSPPTPCSSRPWFTSGMGARQTAGQGGEGEARPVTNATAVPTAAAIGYLAQQYEVHFSAKCRSRPTGRAATAPAGAQSGSWRSRCVRRSYADVTVRAMRAVCRDHQSSMLIASKPLVGTRREMKKPITRDSGACSRIRSLQALKLHPVVNMSSTRKTIGGSVSSIDTARRSFARRASGSRVSSFSCAASRD